MSAFSKSQLALRKNSGQMCTAGESGALIILLLDRSGSMKDYGQAPKSSANERIQQLKSEPGAERTQMSIWTFAHNVRVDIPPQPLLGISELTHYEASGGTNLYRVVSEALQTGLEFQKYALEAYSSKINVGIAVITDGDDTDSQGHLYHPKCLTLANNARNKGFNLGVIGIGINGPSIAKKIGFEPGYSHSVENTEEGVRQATGHSSILFTNTMMYPMKDPPSSNSR